MVNYSITVTSFLVNKGEYINALWVSTTRFSPGTS